MVTTMPYDRKQHILDDLKAKVGDLEEIYHWSAKANVCARRQRDRARQRVRADAGPCETRDPVWWTFSPNNAAAGSVVTVAAIVNGSPMSLRVTFGATGEVAYETMRRFAYFMDTVYTARRVLDAQGLVVPHRIVKTQGGTFVVCDATDAPTVEVVNKVGRVLTFRMWADVAGIARG